MHLLTGVSLPRLTPLFLAVFLIVGWKGTLGAHNRQHVIVPDSLGAPRWACQTHYGNDRTAESEHSLLHREEKKLWREEAGLISLAILLSFSLPARGVIPLSLSFITLQR